MPAVHQFHSAFVGDEPGGWLREQLGKVIDRDQQPHHEYAAPTVSAYAGRFIATMCAPKELTKPESDNTAS
jgi:hypothetical protein